MMRIRLAAGALLASSAINAVGVVALVGMFVGFALGERSTALTLGRTNDILGLIGALLMAPAVLEIHLVAGPDRRVLRTVVAVVGIGAIAAIVVLQALLITERLTFERQIGPVMVAYLAIAAWFIIGGWAASKAGVMPNGGRLGVIAATYAGQPLWALRWARTLLAIADARRGGRVAMPQVAPLADDTVQTA